MHATATTEIYTRSLHDALPIYGSSTSAWLPPTPWMMPLLKWAPALWSLSTVSARSATSTAKRFQPPGSGFLPSGSRSEEHTSELQSRVDLVCRLLLEKKKQIL